MALVAATPYPSFETCLFVLEFVVTSIVRKFSASFVQYLPCHLNSFDDVSLPFFNNDLFTVKRYVLHVVQLHVFGLALAPS